MKPHTRRIWIFIGLKLKEIGIVLAWIIGVCAIIYGDYCLATLCSKEKDMIIVFTLLFIIGNLSLVLLGCALIWTIIPWVKEKFVYWINNNWEKAGEIERETRRKK